MKAGRRPLSQSITAVAPSVSFGPPEDGQPSEWPVPGDSECTTPKPRGSQAASYSSLMSGLVSKPVKNACGLRVEVAPSSWSTSQLLAAPVPAKYGLSS